MIKLYPMPVNITEKEGTYEFLYVSVKGIENKTILDVYSGMGIILSECKASNVIYTKTYNFSEEEYEIIINENGAEIVYTCESGAFYGTQTLCQLINMKKVSYLEIKDNPLHKNRKLHLDISRGKIPTMEHFKEIIDYAAMARYNIFALYYDRIVFKFPSLEGLWEEDAITTDELWQIKKWCNEKFIKLTIDTEAFGHLANFLKTDRFKHLSNSLDENKPNGDLNPLDPESVEFVDMLIGDIAPFVDTEFLNVGFDEVASLKTGKTKDEVAKKGEARVYIDFLNKINNLITEKYNKIPIFWCDMFFGVKKTEEEVLDFLKLFPKNAIAGDWGYEQEYEYHKFERNNRLCKEAGLKFFNYASTSLFSQYVARTYNQTLNAEVACRQGYEHGAYGVATTTWGDDGNSQFFVSELGGIFTFGSTAWNYKDFQLSYVHDFMNKFVYKAKDCNFAGIVAGFGDAAWFTKGKCPDSNQFVFASKCSYDNTLLWNGYHAHTGIKQIHIYDMVDIYGCEKAIEHVACLREKLENAQLSCEKATEVKEKLLLNVRMFEWVIKLSYFKLCMLVTKDYEKARELIPQINFCTDDIQKNFFKLWVTENRPALGSIFIGNIERRVKEFNEYIKNMPELN